MKMLFLPVSLYLLMSAAVNAQGLASLSDSDLCSSIGEAAANNDRAGLAQLEAEGERRDRHKLTRITPEECQHLATDAVNKKLQPSLDKEDRKLDAAVSDLEKKQSSQIY